MSKMNSLLSKRLKGKAPSTKMTALAQRSVSGNLNGMAGVFGDAPLSPFEKQQLRSILEKHLREAPSQLEEDLHSLEALTSEVKAINNQAAILHGERIKKAQDILTQYEEGAFTAWLLATYGNRQTPYNFLHYFLFYQVTPEKLRQQLEEMPRQAIYTLATREGPLKEKLDLLKAYSGETKQEILETIRETFPLKEKDQRQRSCYDKVIHALHQAEKALKTRKRKLGPNQIQTLHNTLQSLSHLIDS